MTHKRRTVLKIQRDEHLALKNDMSWRQRVLVNITLILLYFKSKYLTAKGFYWRGILSVLKGRPQRNSWHQERNIFKVAEDKIYSTTSTSAVWHGQIFRKWQTVSCKPLGTTACSWHVLTVQSIYKSDKVTWKVLSCTTLVFNLFQSFAPSFLHCTPSERPRSM